MTGARREFETGQTQRQPYYLGFERNWLGTGTGPASFGWRHAILIVKNLAKILGVVVSVLIGWI